jgi:hypothetical protein
MLLGASLVVLCTMLSSTVRAQGSEEPPASQAAQPPSGQSRPAGEAPQERPAGEVSLRGQQVLLGRGEVVLDLAFVYARNDDYVLAVVGGGIGLATLRQEAYTTLLQARVGLLKETELFSGVTYRRQQRRQLFGPVDTTLERQDQFGGTTIGIRRTIVGERGRRPSIIASFSGLIPGEEGAPVVAAGVVLVKSVDPAAVFLNANYSRGLRRDASTDDPFTRRDSVDVSVGYALALNDTLAISMTVSGIFRGGVTLLDSARLRLPANYVARFGVTSWVAKGLYIEPSLSIGLTGPGRSVAFGLTMPYAF